jgi:hypothetical protein
VNPVDSANVVLGALKNYDKDTDIVSFDQVEWITSEDTARIEELQLDGNKWVLYL